MRIAMRQDPELTSVTGAGVGCAILALVIIGFFGHRYYRNSHPAKSANKEPPKYDGETK